MNTGYDDNMPFHTSESVAARATKLYFEIEKHFCLGGEALSNKEIMDMLGTTSTSVAHRYIEQLLDWGLIRKMPHKWRTIVLAESNYPPVEWRKL